MFAKAFVINLPFKTDRLVVFQKSVPKCFGHVEVWLAVHGDTVRPPEWWKSGEGAWGCYRSHLQILEHCYQHQFESYVVFEDDAIFRSDCELLLTQFLSELPTDWEMVYLGGQLLHELQHPPQRVTDSVMIPYNVNRTHAFAVHRRGYDRVYKHLNQTPFHKHEHVDHHLGRLHESGKLKLYCPGKWLVGQDGGPSNISGNTNAATFWIDPEKFVHGWSTEETKPCVFLESTIETAIELERRGWHRGHWQNEQRLDRGVCHALVSLDVKDGLRQWYKAVLPEAVRQGNRCVCLFHPSLAWNTVEPLAFEQLVRIQAANADEAEQQFTKFLASLVETPKPHPIPLKNLIYHIWPKRGNGTWQWNIEQLLKRIDLFDGIRSIAVVTDHDSDSLADVQAMLHGVRVDNWLALANNPQLGEVATFRKLVESVSQMPGVTFYGHAKGVSYDNPNETREWSDMMYQICLDDIEHVLSSLKLSPMAGPFTNTEWHEGNKYGWHYSGTFFWFRNQDVSEKLWPEEVMQSRWGVELWPGSLFKLEEVGVLFGQNCGRMYNPETLAHMKQWMAGWLRQRPAQPACQKGEQETGEQ